MPNANAFADLQTPTQFGLTAISSTSFQVVYAPKGGNTLGFLRGQRNAPHPELVTAGI
jgi:hypothetical protein